MPGATIAFAVAMSSSRYCESDMRVVWRRAAKRDGARNASAERSARTKATKLRMLMLVWVGLDFRGIRAI